jgi:threonine aldolase
MTSTAKIARPRHFASDNYAGICPEAWTALQEANRDHAPAYGEDAWTGRAADLIRHTFQADSDVYFVFNGTAANSLALASMCQSYHSILCHELAHIETDECGAPEFFSNGTKLLLLPGANGKVAPAAIEHAATRRSDLHFPKPRVVSVTQATEVGTVYSAEELRAISHAARSLGLRLHMDGARFANAVAALDTQPRAITADVGVDVLSLGCTKNGGLMGEAVVFFDRALAREFEWRCKQAGQLCSKMRFVAAVWVGLLQSGAWLRNARHSNAMARLLERRIDELGRVRILFPRQANSVFVVLPDPAIRAMHDRGWRFYTFIGAGGCRLMCSWDTTEQDVADFVADLAACLR